ncbi:MAG: N-6 DNA methylase [Sulfuricurvum sp.]|nr:N-6 DNA methylase [Sulfuricurvum sp.]
MKALYKEFDSIFMNMARYRSRWEVFSDFLSMASISFLNAVLFSRDREDKYMAIASRYSSEELDQFAKLIAITILALDRQHCDFLGEAFMRNNLGSDYKGQFFTPYHISLFMAQISFGNTKEIERVVSQKGHISISEPACGAGGMIIATDEVLRSAGFSSDNFWVQAQDVDLMACQMCHIQLTILNIPAKIIWGNTLSLETCDVFYTPAYILDDWHNRINESVVIAA